MTVNFDTFVYMAPPLEDNSDTAYRHLCFSHGADVTFSEMARLKGIVANNASTIRKTALLDDTPTIIQLLVSSETELETYLASFVASPGFRGFNLNMGCPSTKLIKLGLGCATIKRIAKTQRIVSIFKKHGYPVSIKMRLGMNAYEKERKVYLNLVAQVDADFFIVHARHGKQNYDDPADFSVYEELVATGKNIIANGDIHTLAQITQLQEIGVKGVMIGRAAVYNPAIFDLLKSNPIPSFAELQTEYLELCERFATPAKYRENILPRIGKIKSIGAQMQSG